MPAYILHNLNPQQPTPQLTNKSRSLLPAILDSQSLEPDNPQKLHRPNLPNLRPGNPAANLHNIQVLQHPILRPSGLMVQSDNLTLGLAVHPTMASAGKQHAPSTPQHPHPNPLHPRLQPQPPPHSHLRVQDNPIPGTDPQEPSSLILYILDHLLC